MGWVRVSDDFYDHPKFTEAGPLGTAIWLAGMAYCNRNLTDGYLPRSKARGLLDWDGVYVETPTGEMMEAMDGYATTIAVIAGLWHEDGHTCPVCPQPGPRHYYVHDYLHYQPSKEQVEETRAQRSAAGRKGGQAKAKQVAKQPAKQTASNVSSKTASKIVPPIPSPNPKPKPTPNPGPFQELSAHQSVPEMVPTGNELTSLARFRKFDPEAIRAELARFIDQPDDDEVARVAVHVLDKAPAPVRNPTRYILTAIMNDEFDIEQIAYGDIA